MNELFNIKDYVVVITGGTGVLGRTIARYLALEGAQVVILGRKESVGKEIVDGIAKEGGKAEFMKTDVMNQELVQKNCDAILGKYGRVDTLLNAAGGNMPGAVISPDGDIFDLKVEEFQKVLDLNLTGTVIPTQVFLKPMVKQGKGSIINFSSMAAFRPITRVCGYAAAKAGISNFGHRVRQEVRRGHPRQRHSPRLLHHRAEPHAADQPRRLVHTARQGRHPPDPVRPDGRPRGAVRHHTLPHE